MKQSCQIYLLAHVVDWGWGEKNLSHEKVKARSPVGEMGAAQRVGLMAAALAEAGPAGRLQGGMDELAAAQM